MIVKNTNEGWRIITQTNHAFLATQIAQALKENFRTEYWLETLLAISNHETLETDFNSGERINNLNLPIDFREATSSKKELYSKIESMVRKASNRSIIVGALIAEHLLFLHKPDINKKSIISLCEDTIKNAKSLHKIDDTTFKKMYGVVRFCDRLSLMICTEELPDLDRKFEINDSLDIGKVFLYLKDKSIKVTPWPFQKETCSIYIEHKLLTKSHFKDDNDFINVFQKSLVENSIFELSK